MEGLDYWRLCDELTVIQAALLIAGDDPSSAQEYVEQWEPAKRPLGYEAAKAAISHALRCGEIEGTWIRLPAESVGGYVYRVYAETCGLILAFLGSGGRNAAMIFSLRNSSSR